MRHAKQYKRGSRGKAAVFFLVLFAFGIFSMLLPLRPSHSEMENRDLTKFPAFSAQDLWPAGNYTKGIDTWFADTFPVAGCVPPAERLGGVSLRHQNCGNRGQRGTGRRDP